MALLTRRDPIELFDEISLYESELDDHGVSSLSVKIRVTESCWFLLLRFWLCVDGVLAFSRNAFMLRLETASRCNHRKSRCRRPPRNAPARGNLVAAERPRRLDRREAVQGRRSGGVGVASQRRTRPRRQRKAGNILV